MALLLVAIGKSLPAHADSEFLCQVMASDRVEIGSQVPGVIEQVMVERGDKVEAGQVVAQLRADLERVAVDLASAKASNDTAVRARQAKVAFAKRKLDRNVELAANHVVSANDLDSMRTDYDIAQREVEAAVAAHNEAQIELRKVKVDLEMRTIRSPFPGIITERKLTAGALVRDQPIVVIQRIDPLFVEVSLPVSLMNAVKPGTKARIDFDTPGVASVEAEVTLSDIVIDAPSDTFGARIVLPNPSGAIPAGSKCRAEFLAAQR
ncbi:MAG: efflux RND transporter periplasmic adaptor subunit [Pseudolabrys sp.]